jgi:hypothetical protein
MLATQLRDCLVCGEPVLHKRGEPPICSKHNYDQVMEVFLEAIAYELFDKEKEVASVN